MVTFTNDFGQEPSPAAPPEFGKPSAFQLKATEQLRTRATLTGRPFQPAYLPYIVARVGREGIDTTRCQAPSKPALPHASHRGRLRCDRPATCVAVENKARPDGAIGGLALCDLCAGVIKARGPAYAKITPLTP